MLPMDGNHCWMFAVKTVLLFCGIFLNNHICESTDTNGNCTLKSVLFISATKLNQSYFPSDTVYQEGTEINLCFNIQPDSKRAECCNTTNFSCNIEVKEYGKDRYSLNLTEKILVNQDIVVMKEPQQNYSNYSCMPSKLYNKMNSSGNTRSSFLLNIHHCLNKSTKNIRLSKGGICSNNSTYNEEACNGVEETHYVIFENKTCVSCKKPPLQKPEKSINISILEKDIPTTPEKAAEVMKNLSSWTELMGNSSTAAIKIGNITGVIAKLPRENQTNMSFAITEKADINIVGENSNSLMGSFLLFKIPEEASAMAVKRNGSFVGILLFPDIHLDDKSKYLFSSELVGIEMGAKVENLSQTIDIQYSNVDKNGASASCVSWDGSSTDKNGKQLWITDGCQTKETNNSITCQCSHLTFFAILMSPPPANISASDVNSLTYITSIGCGLSLFFLAVGLFIHVLVRKGKASQATKILMNLFIAMIILNLSFLTNESITKLEMFGACVAIAVVLHYSMLATFTWFFMQALHLYFNLRRIPTEVKYYMLKICITGWVIPAVVVIILLASKKYDYININTNDGTTAKMCWIPDAAVHQGVNVGYYAVVFVFTLSVFIVTMRQIFLLPTAGKAPNKNSPKTNAFTILGLLLLLGITWAFAFFAQGPLLLASYYIFTILNSFQGFFLFIYYYHSSKIIGENKTHTKSSSIETSNMTVTSPYG